MLQFRAVILRFSRTYRVRTETLILEYESDCNNSNFMIKY